MVTITNGSQVLTVTKGAYNSMYAPQGWEITADKITNREDNLSLSSENKEITQSEPESQNYTTKSDVEDDKSNESENDEEVELSEIPISEMSVSQLKTYAKQLGIEVNTDSARQLRTQIRKALEG